MKSIPRFKKSLIALFAVGLMLASCTQEEDLLSADSAVPTYESIQKGLNTKSVTVVDAQKVATSFVSNRYGAPLSIQSSRSTQSIEFIKDPTGKTVAYIINSPGAGWVIVSATKNYHPILAYSSNSDDVFNSSIVSGGLNLWMDDIKEAIYASEEQDSITLSHIAEEWDALSNSPLSVVSPLPGSSSEQATACRNRLKYLNDTYYKEGWTFYTLSAVPSDRVPKNVISSQASSYSSPEQFTIVGVRDKGTNTFVDALVKVKWHQRHPLNLYCNGDSAGPAPIAMVQLMSYHKIPKQYDWENANPHLGNESIRQLIAKIGTDMGINYGSGKLSTSVEAANREFQSLGYNTTLKSHNMNDVHAEIALNHRPVFMQGAGKDGMHAWVCDGVKSHSYRYEYYVEYINSSNNYSTYGESSLSYPDSYVPPIHPTPEFHMNWGWTTSGNDGWFIGDNVKVPNREYPNNRMNIYVTPK